MAVRMWPADADVAWFCETAEEPASGSDIDATLVSR
jgi:hypothetical protein